MIRALAPFLAFAMLVPGCATASSEERRAYVLAHPHGWLEITISDASIPDVPSPEGADEPWRCPTSCGVSVEVNGEPVLRDSAYPNGESAPYSASTGFRFPVPVGDAELTLSYYRCRVADGEVAALELAAMLVIAEGQTHEVVFDGADLAVRAPRPNEVVTLEDVYEAVTGRRSTGD